MPNTLCHAYDVEGLLFLSLSRYIYIYISIIMIIYLSTSIGIIWLLIHYVMHASRASCTTHIYIYTHTYMYIQYIYIYIYIYQHITLIIIMSISCHAHVEGLLILTIEIVNNNLLKLADLLGNMFFPYNPPFYTTTLYIYVEGLLHDLLRRGVQGGGGLRPAAHYY